MINGPAIPDFGSCFEENAAYLDHIRKAIADQLAGGYHEIFGLCRALLDARVDLLN